MGQQLTGISDVLILEEPRLKHDLDLEMIGLEFGFTLSELEVACLLVDGKGTQEIALERGVKESTIRSQILSILEKSGAENRQQLVSTLLRFQKRNWPK